VTRRRLPLVAALATTAAAAAPAATAAAESPGPLRAAGVHGPYGHERLSNERTLTRIGYPTLLYRIRSRPGRQHPVTGKLRFYTEDRAPENYLVLRSTIASNGKPWLQIRVPRRPNGSKGWVPGPALQIRTLKTQLEIDKSRQTAWLRRDGEKIWRSPVGIGAPGTPTPAGRFWVRERLRNLGGSPIYGPWAFGTAAYSTLSDWPGGGVVGIHGTDQPGLLPGRVSHGCIRVPNRNIEKLERLMPVGTPVWIHR
jgi:lipoprotein-anchoring transpeptidase ErfK/SrfK